MLSGGGSNGAWEAGVIHGLVNSNSGDDYQWDVVTGVSAGSINSAFLSVFDKGDEVKASEWIVNQWSNLKNDNLYKNWPMGVVQGFINKQSMYDTSVGVEYLRNLFSQFPNKFRRSVSVTAVDVNTAEPHTMTDKNTKFEDFQHAVMASASIPLVFPPTYFQGKVLMDGGTMWNTNP